MTPGQILAQVVVDIAKFLLYAYGVQSARVFLLAWLESRTGRPLFTTQRLSREQAIDAARKFGITEADLVKPVKVRGRVARLLGSEA
jgi:hypothetical protein